MYWFYYGNGITEYLISKNKYNLFFSSRDWKKYQSKSDFINCNLISFDDLKKINLSFRIDIIIHLASETSDFEKVIKTNLNISKLIIDVMIFHKVQKIHLFKQRLNLFKLW